MRVVVGLGNPGQAYCDTRHNVGFAVCDLLAQRTAAPSWRKAHRGLVCQVQLGGRSVLLLKPQTFMNLSGESVAALSKFYKVEPQEVVVVHDELDFAPGIVRLKPDGGHGGHNGLRSLIDHLGPNFGRIRLGIGRPPGANTVNYVLGRPSGDAKEAIGAGVQTAAEAVLDIAERGFSACMNELNRRP